MTEDVKRLIRSLTYSKKTGADLATILGLSGSEEVRAIVHAARLEGYPVCADRRGYWLGEDAEVVATAQSMTKRAESILSAAAGMLGGLK